MTRTKHLEQSWRNLELDVQRRLSSANAQATTIATKRHEDNPNSRFPSMQSTDELAAWNRASAFASVLDLVHTAMRELGLRYD
jgi:hypothetical protein